MSARSAPGEITPGHRPTPEEVRKIGEARESWCTVEKSKEESWCRKTRRHHKDHFQSTVFDIHQPVYEPRCTFKVDKPTHKELKHFGSPHESQLKT